MMNMNSDSYGHSTQNQCRGCNQLGEEYREMKELSFQIEKELEAEIEQLTQEKKKALEKNEHVLRQIQDLRQKHSKETCAYEKTLDRMQNENSNLREELKVKCRVVTSSEIEIERLESQLRESQSIISDLESRIEQTLEHLTILHSQLEETKMQNEEEIERLKEKLREANNEVRAIQTRQNSNVLGSDTLPSTSFMTSSQIEWFNVPMKYSGASKAKENADPSPQKKIKIELGKRSYQQLDESHNQFTRVGANKSLTRAKRSKNGVAKSFASPINPLVNERVRAFDQNNILQNNIQSLSSLNTMNEGFAKSLSMVNNIMEELDREPISTPNLTINQNFNFMSQTDNLNSLNNNLSNMFSSFSNFSGNNFF